MIVIKKLVFFTDDVIKRIGKKTAKIMITFGSFTRRTAQLSMRTSKGVSKPGQPPFSHIGTLKNLIYFHYDEQNQELVVGPVLAKSKVSGVPRILEHGGMERKVELKTGKYHTDTYAPHPFMLPAAMKNLSKVREMYANEPV